MANELPPNDVRSVWQNQAVEGTKMSLDEIRRKVDCFRTGLRRQNRIAYILLAVLVGAFGWVTVGFRPTNLIMRTGGCLVVLGCLYMGCQVYTRGARRSAPSDAGFADCLNFYRSELERLRDFHNAVWSRLLAVIPGYMVFCLGFAMAFRKGALVIGAIALIALALGLYGMWLQHWLGRRVQREIDALNAGGKQELMGGPSPNAW